MTLWDLIRSMVRRWPVLLAGAILTVGVAGYGVRHHQVVYWTRTDVVFLAPPSSTFPNSLKTTSEDLIITAGIVGKRVSGPGKVMKFTSPDAGLIGLSVKRGWSIRLPDIGGQWAPDFENQWLTVEVIGPDPAWVLSKKDQLVTRIAHALDDLQREEGVKPVNAITTKASPGTSVAYPVTGSRIRALAMTLALGGAATLWTVLMLSWRAARRSAQYPGQGSGPGSGQRSPAEKARAPQPVG